MKHDSIIYNIAIYTIDLLYTVDTRTRHSNPNSDEQRHLQILFLFPHNHTVEPASLISCYCSYSWKLQKLTHCTSSHYFPKPRAGLLCTPVNSFNSLVKSFNPCLAQNLFHCKYHSNEWQTIIGNWGRAIIHKEEEDLRPKGPFRPISCDSVVWYANSKGHGCRQHFSEALCSNSEGAAPTCEAAGASYSKT